MCDIIIMRGVIMWLNKLKEMKKQSGKTAKQIADETGVPKSTIDKLFSGQTKEPYISSTKLIVNCLGYTLDDLFSFNNNTNYFECNDHEQALVIAYRNKPEMQPAVDKILEIDTETETVLMAARSKDNKPVGYIEIPKSKLDSFDSIAPVTNEDDI